MPPLSEEDRRRQYDRAVAEYRFQVDLNWRRSEYFFVLNIGVLVASATLFSSNDVPRVLVAALFTVGTLLAALSFLANDVQRGYYRSARDRKQELEKSLGLQDVALATTPGMGSGIERLGRVGTFLKIMLVAIAVADLIGAGFAVADAAGSPAAVRHPPIVIFRLGATPGKLAGEAVVVVSRGGRPVRSQTYRPEQQVLSLDLEPGDYLGSVVGLRFVCEKDFEVGSKPLQRVHLPCRSTRK